jgi:AraC-like DNA-binding protein
MARGFAVDPGWRLLWHDLGVRTVDVLRRACLPADLLTREGRTLSPAEYFRLWQALEALVAAPVPLRIVERYAVEAFQAPLFAALCSPDLRTACERLASYKRLIGPMAMRLGSPRRDLSVSLRILGTTEAPPAGLLLAEFAFILRLARLGTREPISARRITLRAPPTGDRDDYERFFGVRLERGPSDVLTFSEQDAARPFLTADDRLWAVFEPELRRRLDRFEAETTASDRARSALLELLPSGRASLDEVARSLAVSPRTLQRQLRQERSPFQRVLGETRRELALHYLGKTNMQLSEISFLLGYTNTNSFFRAFHSWTGQTPRSVRRGAMER